MYHTSQKDVFQHIEDQITHYGLSKENEDGYLLLRETYNATPLHQRDPFDLYTLLCYSYNYQIRFNNSHNYNNPFGRSKSHFSPALKKRLGLFLDTLTQKNITFTAQEFSKIDLSHCTPQSLIYADPPYLITTGSYNDGKRGFSGWSIDHEHKLLTMLDTLHKRGVRFALSNVLRHKDRENKPLIAWSKKYIVHPLRKSYSNSSHNTSRKSSEEVLITNYDHSGTLKKNLGT